MTYSRPFPVDPVLTGIAIGYVNTAQSLIADKVLPRVPVSGEKFKWLRYPLEQGFTVPDSNVSRRGAPNRASFSAVEETASVSDYALDDSIPNTDIESAAAQRAQGRSSFDPVNHATQMLTNLILLDREIRVASLIQDPNTYNASRRIALSGTARFSDYSGSDPIGVIKAGLDGTLVYRPNTIVMGQSVWSVISSHPHLVNAVKGNSTGRGNITRREFADLFEIKDVIVGESFVNTAKKGQDVNIQRVWGKSMQLLYIDPQARPEAGVTFGYTAEYGGRIAGRFTDVDVGIEGGARVRVGERVKEVICAQDVGYQIQNAIA